jgi:hypothetical protein
MAAALDQQSKRVADWRQLLDGLSSLSPRYRTRYAIVLAQLERRAEMSARRAAQFAVTDGQDAGRAAAILAGASKPPTPARGAGGTSYTVTGSGPVFSLVKNLIEYHDDVAAFVTQQPHLEQTSVPLHPSRRAHLVRVDGRKLVALRWSIDSLESRAAYQRRMVEVLAAASRAAPLVLVALDEYAHVRGCEADLWVFAPNLGRTLEDRLRWDDFGPGERDLVIESMVALRRAMVSARLVWQGFAPRNMFLGDGRLVLIDFEEVVETDADPARAAECLWWHRVFFADCLTADEAARVFAPVPGEPIVDDEHVLTADDFERALLGVASVAWRERRELLRASAALEGRHIRPDGGILYGHELGHFWGDFAAVEDEARLFRMLRAVGEPEQLTAVLEVFEAAMEADICRTLRLRAYQASDFASPRTAAVIDVLEIVGATELAGLRLGNADWYTRLTDDPGLLVDELVHRAASTANGLDSSQLDTYLIGNTDSRKAHEDSLMTANRIGLDFLHHADEPFLHHREPEELRTLLSGPLPRDGTDIDVLLADVEQLVARYAVAQSHPAYLAFPDSGNAVAALAGGVLGRMLNQNLIAVDRSAPSATFVEIQVTEWLRELVGYKSWPLGDLHGVRDVAGLWSTGGHLSNHIAMLVALGRRFPQVRRRGLTGLDTQPAVVMAGPIAHYSHSDAAFHLGLGWDAIITVGAEAGYTTDPAAVDAALAAMPGR